jgi:UDP-hydrolysing UDP-N-acetyl-D-glucosamine 2-epimerase
VISTSRADYGLLYWVLRGLAASPRASLQLILMGSHFSVAHGSTHRAARADGFDVAAEIRAVPRGDSERAIARSIGEATIALADAFARLRPELVVVLGDRYELLAVGAAATIFRLPIAHLNGGETTEGAIDEAVRHAVTKLSHLHLVAARPQARRVAALGEERWRIRVVGAPGLDHLTRTKLPPAAEVLRDVGLPADDRPLFLVTQHPVTLRRGASRAEARALARAISSFDARVLVTASNADPEYRAIAAELRAISARRPTIRFAPNLGTAAYWSLLRAADAVIGNSSSGLLEAPSFGTPVVNVGDRQRGRLRAANVIDVGPTAVAIRAGITRALTPAFRRAARRARNPYGGPGASDRITRILTTEPLGPRLLEKREPRA